LNFKINHFLVGGGGGVRFIPGFIPGGAIPFFNWGGFWGTTIMIYSTSWLVVFNCSFYSIFWSFTVTFSSIVVILVSSAEENY